LKASTEEFTLPPVATKTRDIRRPPVTYVCRR
jgi:hypothetical protein